MDFSKFRFFRFSRNFDFWKFWKFWNFEISKINFLQDEKILFIRFFLIVLIYSSAIPNIYLELPQRFQEDAIQHKYFALFSKIHPNSRILLILKSMVPIISPCWMWDLRMWDFFSFWFLYLEKIFFEKYFSYINSKFPQESKNHT